MSADIEIEDVEDALKRANEYAKLMGRTKKNIVADLLDDGQLNFSAGSDSKSVLDRATDQAKKLQGLLTTLVPIIALLLSIGAEGFGIVDLTGWDFIGDEDKDNDGAPVYIYGCMNDKPIMMKMRLEMTIVVNMHHLRNPMGQDANLIFMMCNSFMPIPIMIV